MRKKTRLMIGLTVTTALALGFAYFLVPNITWSGAVVVLVNIKVLESSSLEPMSNISVIYKFPDCDSNTDGNGRSKNCGQHFFDLVSDAGGLCTFPAYFPACGRRTLFGRSGKYGIINHIRVEEEGYLPFEAPLADLVVETTRSVKNLHPIDIEIRLSRKPPDEMEK